MDDHFPLDDETWTADQRRQWSRACGFLRASRTSLMRLMDAHSEHISSNEPNGQCIKDAPTSE